MRLENTEWERGDRWLYDLQHRTVLSDGLSPLQLKAVVNLTHLVGRGVNEVEASDDHQSIHL